MQVDHQREVSGNENGRQSKNPPEPSGPRLKSDALRLQLAGIGHTLLDLSCTRLMTTTSI
jgi:hypothetical protein